MAKELSYEEAFGAPATTAPTPEATPAPVATGELSYEEAFAEPAPVQQAPADPVDPQEAFIDNLSKQDKSLIDEAAGMLQDIKVKRNEATQLPDGDEKRLKLEQEASELEKSIPSYEEAFARRHERETAEWGKKSMKEKASAFMEGTGEVAAAVPGAAVDFAGQAIGGAVDIVKRADTLQREMGWFNPGYKLFNKAFGRDEAPKAGESEKALKEMGSAVLSGGAQAGMMAGSAARGLEYLARLGNIDKDTSKKFFRQRLRDASELADIETGKLIADVTGKDSQQLDREAVSRMSIYAQPDLFVGGGAGKAMAKNVVEGVVEGTAKKAPGIIRRSVDVVGDVTGKAAGKTAQFAGDKMMRYGNSKFASALAWGTIVGGGMTGNVPAMILGAKGLAIQKAAKVAGGAISTEGRRMAGEFIPKSGFRTGVEGLVSGGVKGGAAGGAAVGIMNAPMIAEAETPEQQAGMIAPGVVFGAVGGGLERAGENIKYRNTPPDQRGVVPGAPVTPESPVDANGKPLPLDYVPPTERNPMTDGGEPVYTGPERPAPKEPLALEQGTYEMAYDPELKMWVERPVIENPREGMDPKYKTMIDIKTGKPVTVQESPAQIDMKAAKLVSEGETTYTGPERPVRSPVEEASQQNQPILALPEPQKVQGEGNFNPDAVAALGVLGYKAKEAQRMLTGLPDGTPEDLVRGALATQRPIGTVVEPSRVASKAPAVLESLPEGLDTTPAPKEATAPISEQPANVIDMNRPEQTILPMDVPVNEPTPKAPVTRVKPKMQGEQIEFDIQDPRKPKSEAGTKLADALKGGNKVTGESGFVRIPEWSEIKDTAISLYDGVKDFSTWSKDMITKFGQDIAEHLSGIWDQITNAYQNSFLSDETGAVGSINSKSFAARVKANKEAAANRVIEKGWNLTQENIPDPTQKLENLPKADYETKQAYHKEVNRVLTNPRTKTDRVADVANQILEEAGIKVRVKPSKDTTSPGSFVNPETRIEENNPSETIAFGTGKQARLMAELYGILKGHVTSQNAIAGYSASPKGSMAGRAFDVGRALTIDERKAVSKQIIDTLEANGVDPFPTGPDGGGHGDFVQVNLKNGHGITHLGFDPSITPEIRDAVFRDLDDLSESLNEKGIDASNYKADTFLTGKNDYEQRLNSIIEELKAEGGGVGTGIDPGADRGTGLEGEGSTGGSRNLLDRVAHLKSAVDSVNADYSAKGFGKPGTPFEVNALIPRGEGDPVPYIKKYPEAVSEYTFGDLSSLEGKKIGLNEADRQDASGETLGGMQYPFLKSNTESVVTAPDGKTYQPVWASQGEIMKDKMRDKVRKRTDEGHVMMHIMGEDSHASNSQFFASLLGKVESTPEQLEAVKAVIGIGEEPTKQQAKYIKELKSAGADSKKVAKVNEKYSQEDWFKGAVENFEKAKTTLEIAKGKSFNGRAAAVEVLRKLDFTGSHVEDHLNTTRDFVNVRSGDGVGVVQMSTDPSVFAVWTGKTDLTPTKEWSSSDVSTFNKMTPSEKAIREQLLTNGKFKAHPSYDWTILGPEGGENFILSKPVDPTTSLVPEFPQDAQMDMFGGEAPKQIRKVNPNESPATKRAQDIYGMKSGVGFSLRVPKSAE